MNGTDLQDQQARVRDYPVVLMGESTVH